MIVYNRSRYLCAHHIGEAPAYIYRILGVWETNIFLVMGVISLGSFYMANTMILERRGVFFGVILDNVQILGGWVF